MQRTIGVCLALFALTAPLEAAAKGGITVKFRPTGDPQIAVWLEKTDGTFVDTLMVTRLVGTFGLGNRPGRQDFGAGYLWPYGKREHALPAWAHRRGRPYERLVFQDCREDSLGWHENNSSIEPFYCRPVTPAEMGVDAITCPSTSFRSDKGVPLSVVSRNGSAECVAVAQSSPSISVYPPRNDLVTHDSAHDWAGAREYNEANDLDAVSQATPVPDTDYSISWGVPDAYPAGDYYIFVEVNQEYDLNEYHDYGFYREPALDDYGITGQGQPSVLFRVPITIGDSVNEDGTKDYFGYGDPMGKDGQIRPPDQTITTGVNGSGEGRLLPMSTQDRVVVKYDPEEGPPPHSNDPNNPTPVPGCDTPPAVGNLTVVESDFHFVVLEFEPAGEGMRYQVRYAQGRDTIGTNDAFSSAIPGPQVESVGAARFRIRIEMLRPETEYTFAVRAFNECHMGSEVAAVTGRTDERVFRTVDACFIATAAHGSLDDDNVVVLRRFRDRTLLKSDLGRAFVDTYYRVSPPIADVIRERPALRAAVRTLLAPIVWAVRTEE